MTFIDARIGARMSIPHLDSAILAGGGDSCAIERPGNFSDQIRMARVYVYVFACLSIPDVHASVATSTILSYIASCGSDITAIRRPGSGKDLILMTFVGVEEFRIS